MWTWQNAKYRDVAQSTLYETICFEHATYYPCIYLKTPYRALETAII